MTEQLRHMSDADKEWLQQKIRQSTRTEMMKPSTEKALRWFLKRELAYAYVGSSPNESPDIEKASQLLELWKLMEEEDAKT